MIEAIVMLIFSLLCLFLAWACSIILNLYCHPNLAICVMLFGWFNFGKYLRQAVHAFKNRKTPEDNSEV